MKIEHITLIMPYYINPGMLHHQYEVWAAYPQHIKDRIDIILVDDGSPIHPAIDIPRPEGLPALSIYRVDVDIPWNQHGARNLGARMAKDEDWLLLTDMDHVVPAETLENLFALTPKKPCVYTFHRLDAPDMKPTCRPDGSHKPHPNSFAMTKETYWEAGGYDEDFCGMYGTDGLFRSRLYKRFPQKHMESLTIVRYGREVISDASTTTLIRRDAGKPIKGATKKRMEWKSAQGRAGKIMTIQFPWSKLL
jgi:hypothetical protein